MFLPFHGVLSLTASGRLKKRSASANAASTRSSAIGWSTSVLRAQAQASSAHPDRDLGRARGREEAEEEGTHKNPTSEAASMSCCRISSLRASKSRRLICGTPTSLTSMVAGMSSAEGERWKGRGRGGSLSRGGRRGGGRVVRCGGRGEGGRRADGGGALLRRREERVRGRGERTRASERQGRPSRARKGGARGRRTWCGVRAAGESTALLDELARPSVVGATCKRRARSGVLGERRDEGPGAAAGADKPLADERVRIAGELERQRRVREERLRTGSSQCAPGRVRRGEDEDARGPPRRSRRPPTVPPPLVPGPGRQVRSRRP